ncbi:MAG: metallophosphoesterase [Parcubacteria group bacterium]
MDYVFDFIIFFILFFSAYWMYIIVRSFFSNKNRGVKTKIWRIVLLALLLIIFVTVFFGSFIEPRRLVVTPVNINLDKTAAHENIKIAFISDFHLGYYKQAGWAQKVADQIIKLNPDFVLLGGDFIDRDESAARYLAPLQQVASRFPTFAVTGNHEFNLSNSNRADYKDRTATLRRLFKQWNINILDNAHRTFFLRGQLVAFCGIEDIWTGRASLGLAEDGASDRTIKILLAHNPDVILDPRARDFSLILSGHTHAGQFRLPMIGAIAPIPDKLGRAFDYGLFKLKNNQLFITAGVGEGGARARLFSRPEIALITLDL